MLIPSSGSWTLDSASSTRAFSSTTASPLVDASVRPVSVESISLISATSRIFYRQPPFLRRTSVPMRILVVDDHPVTLDGLKSTLATSDEVEIVGQATTGEEAVDAVSQLHPDVVFMDVRMPGMGGIEATRLIREENPATRVILFTVEESRQAIAEAIQAGVSGYLLKDVTAEELVNAAKLALEDKA